jgi:hypothetical protein
MRGGAESAVPGTAANPQAEALWLVPAAAIVLLVWIAASIAAELNGISALPLAARYGVVAMRGVLMTLVLVLGYELARAAWHREPAPAQRLIGALSRTLRTPWLFAAAFGPLVLLPVLCGAFGTLKVLLPHYLPFAHDHLFAELDRALFLGTDPWRVTHAIFGGTVATIVLDEIYTAWLALLPFAIGGFALVAPRTERARFILAMVLTWALLGVAGAWAGSSAGPIFLDLLGHPDAARYEGLMRGLAAADAASPPHGLNALRWRRVLWDAYVERNLSFGMGISAMPSMHNAITMLYALAAFRLNKWLGIAAAAYAVVIFIGSVHLAWHYAIDGIAGGGAVVLIWFGVDRYLKACGYDRLVAAAPRLSRRADPATAAAMR